MPVLTKGFFQRALEYISLRLDSLLSPLLYRLARRFAANGLPQACFEWLYRSPDPWHYLSSPYEQRKQDRALDLASEGSAHRRERALEIGCSEGAFSEKLVTRGIAEQIVGVDISSRAITRARARCARLPQVEFRDANILETAPDGPFDLIFCMEILYYLGRDLRPLGDRLAPLLAPGCRVILVHGWPSDVPLHRSVQDLLHLELVSEHVEKNVARPYVITVLENTVPQATSLSAS